MENDREDGRLEEEEGERLFENEEEENKWRRRKVKGFGNELSWCSMHLTRVSSAVSFRLTHLLGMTEQHRKLRFGF